MNIDLSIGAVVFRKNNLIEFLILKRADNNIWEFAKGHVQEQENEIDTLKRELKEEIGITHFLIISTFKEKISYISSRNVERVMVYYLVNVTDEIIISPEHSEFRWISLNEASNYFKYNDMIELLKKCEVEINGT